MGATLRPGPHVPGCLHGTPGPERHDCCCSYILERQRHALAAARFVSAQAYVGPSPLRTELAGLLRNVAKTEQRLADMSFFDYSARGAALEATQARRQRRIDEIRARLERDGGTL